MKYNILYKKTVKVFYIKMACLPQDFGSSLPFIPSRQTPRHPMTSPESLSYHRAVTPAWYNNNAKLYKEGRSALTVLAPRCPRGWDLTTQRNLGGKPQLPSELLRTTARCAWCTLSSTSGSRVDQTVQFDAEEYSESSPCHVRRGPAYGYEGDEGLSTHQT